jgi:hypothetical protein
MLFDPSLDWEATFESPETGLIPLIMQAKTSETLKQTALLIIHKLHARKSDQPNIEKYSAALDEIFSDFVRKNDLALLKTASKKLLRDVKNERIQMAAEYHLSQESDKTHDRRAAGAAEQNTPFWRRRPTKRLAGAMIVAGLAIFAVIAMMMQNSALSPEREAEGEIAVRWVKNYVERNLSLTPLRLESVRISSNTVIEIAVTVSPARAREIYNELKNEDKNSHLDVLEAVCPRPDSGISRFLSQKWNFQVVFNADHTKLTDGTCQY